MGIVTTEDRGYVRHIVLNRPDKRNAINGEMVVALGVELTAAANDGSVRAVVVRGEGAMFSSGADLNALNDLADNPGNLRPFRTAMLEVFNRCEEMPKPTIAAIHGGCIGGALELALACDLRVSTPDAIMGLPETRIGLIPDVGGSSRLPAVIGLGRAKEMIMTSKLINGEEAERIGLVNRLAGEDGLDAAVDQLVNELLQCAPLAVGLAKRVMDHAAKPALGATLEHEITVQLVCAGSDDYAEGARAVREKRMPDFSGR
jgi:enoyl-CoA hydratase/carnithine racemase